ncbi:hypothetical protein [Pseudomonas lopnurensis]|uniref:hypothetical protein n=1 Tax=Pseudomonas lopnurensis TaxID=1477517 RepID=UPI0028A88784|nr:hypothetical protein [Pseudomonas lopnurensis]
MIYRLAILAAFASLTVGCSTYNANPYGVSVDNVETLKSYSLDPVSVGTFEAAEPGQATITCRAAGPVRVSPSFEGYIQKALTDELKLAGLYAPSSPLMLTGRLEQVDFSSGMTDGNWNFVLTLRNARNESYTTRSSFPFAGSFVADKACQEVAQAFGQSVQQLIADLVRDPEFKRIARSE